MTALLLAPVLLIRLLVTRLTARALGVKTRLLADISKEPSAYWRRALVVLAAPASSFVITIVVVFVVTLAGGRDNAQRVRVASVGSGFAADGILQPGDELVTVNGAPVDGVASLQRATAEGVVHLQVRRAGELLDLDVTPIDGRLGTQLEDVHESAGAGTALKAALVFPFARARDLLQGRITRPIVEGIVPRWRRVLESLAFAAAYFFVILLPVDLGLLVIHATRR